MAQQFYRSPINCLIVLCLLFNLLTVPAIAGIGPKAEIHPSQWDYGYLPQKAKLNHTFYLCNVGDEPLVVNKIKAGCSCTSVSKIDKPIVPGDSAAIEIIFKSGRYLREVRKVTTIFTNCKDTSLSEITLTAYVYKDGDDNMPVSLKPGKLKWTPDDGGKIKGVDTVTINNNSNEILNAGLQFINKELFEISGLPEQIKPGAKAEMIISNKPTEIDITDSYHKIGLRFTGSDTIILTLPIEIKK